MSFADTQLCRPTCYGWPIVMSQTSPKMTSKFLFHAFRTIKSVNKYLLDALLSYLTSYSISVSSAVRLNSLMKWPTSSKWPPSSRPMFKA